MPLSHSPWGVGFAGDEFFVTSFEDDEVWVYDLDGVFDRVFAPTGAEPPDAFSGLLLDNPTDLIFLPEPGGVPALVSGALVLACLRRRRTRSEAHPGRGRAH